MKKVIALLLAAVCVLGLAACGGGETAEGGVPTLTWYVHGDKQTDVATVMAEVNKITEEKIGAKLDLQFIDQPSYTEKMSMMMASGTEFDICFTGYVNTYKNVAQRGGLLALDDYLKETPELYNSIPQYTWDTTRIGGQIYAVPNYQIIGYQINFYTFKDLADKYGLTSQLEPLERISLVQMEEYLEKIRDNEKSYYPIRFNYGGMHFDTYDNTENLSRYKHNLSGATAYFDENGNFIEISNTVLNGDDKYVWEKARDWYERGFIREDIVSMSNDTAEQNAGKYATWIEKWKPGILQELEQKHGREVICYQVTENIYPSTAPDAMTGISKTSKHPELAMKMLELVNTDKELYNLICFGVEGKHYNLDENGRVVYNDEGGYIPKACWKFGNQFNALLLPGQPEDVWEQTKAMNETAVRSPLVGFNLDETAFTNELSATSSVSSEYGVGGKGANPNWAALHEEYAGELKKAGIEKIVEETNRQYQEWLKTQEQ